MGCSAGSCSKAVASLVIMSRPGRPLTAPASSDSRDQRQTLPNRTAPSGRAMRGWAGATARSRFIPTSSVHSTSSKNPPPHPCCPVFWALVQDRSAMEANTSAPHPKARRRTPLTGPIRQLKPSADRSRVSISIDRDPAGFRSIGLIRHRESSRGGGPIGADRDPTSEANPKKSSVP
jgi:hypothetical protein